MLPNIVELIIFIHIKALFERIHFLGDLSFAKQGENISLENAESLPLCQNKSKVSAVLEMMIKNQNVIKSATGYSLSLSVSISLFIQYF